MPQSIWGALAECLFEAAAGFVARSFVETLAAQLIHFISKLPQWLCTLQNFCVQARKMKPDDACAQKGVV